MHQGRIQHAGIARRLMSADEAADFFHDGMTVGLSGFTRAGDCKAIPHALARRARHQPLGLTILTGASLGNDIDSVLAEAGITRRRLPFQSDNLLRRQINDGQVMFLDQHLSETAEQLRDGHIAPVDIAVIEAVAIRADGSIVPSTSVGNSAAFVSQARQVIVELNLAMPLALDGMHDIYLPEARPNRQPIPLTQVDQRIGVSSIPVDPSRIVGVVITDQPDSPARVLPPDAETSAIAAHVVRFLEAEVQAGRLPPELLPLQVGIGAVANAVMQGFGHSALRDLTMYSEVLQDSAIDLLDRGTLAFASAASMTLSTDVYEHVLEHLDHYRERILLRPQEISNHPEIVRRLGIIALNTALEFDIYGNVNSTHVGGTHMMNGIGGSGDFARNAHLAIFVTKATARDGAISSVVPMVAHVDHTEHDVDILVTEFGLADLRGLAPRERATRIIDNCCDPAYRPALQAYFADACQRGGQTPHCLERALSWHQALRTDGDMRALRADVAVAA